MTRDEVLKEFGFVRHNGPMGYDDMADEIDTLRRWNAIRKQAVRIYKRNVELHSQVIDDLLDKLTAVESELGALEKQFTSACRIAQDYCRRHDIGTAGDNVFRVMDVDAERNRSILAALREPSDMIVDALREHIYDLSCFDEAFKAIRIAVAAAEREVLHNEGLARIGQRNAAFFNVSNAVAAAEKEVGQ